MMRNIPAPLTIETLAKGSNNHHQMNIYNARYHGSALSNCRYGNGVPVSHMMSQFTGIGNGYGNNTHMHQYNLSSVVSRIKPEKSNRRNVQKLTWRSSHWIKGFGDDNDDAESGPINSLNISDVSPSVAIRRILLLYENLQFREAANFINRLNYNTFKSILSDLPIDMFIESIPHSLPIMESLYAKVFLSSNDDLTLPLKILRPESVVMHMVRLFAHQNTTISENSNALVPYFHERLETSSMSSCKKLLKVITLTEPRLRKHLRSKKRSLDKAIEGMGHHGLVGTSDDTLINLHEALKLEFERVIQQYKTAVQKLEELSLAKKDPVARSLSQGPAPTNASHQRLLNLKQQEIQERLIKNKTLLNAVEPCSFTNHALQILLGILQQRIEHDKEVLFQFTQLRKEYTSRTSTNLIDPGAIVAPVLMRFSHGCGQVLNLIKEVQEGDNMADGEDNDESSDISGYHSDSDSAIIMNSPLNISHHSKSAKKYNTVLYRSVRVKGTRPSARRLTSAGSGNSSDTISVSGKSDSGNSSATGNNTTAKFKPSETIVNDGSTIASSNGSVTGSSPIMVKGSIWTHHVEDNTEIDVLRRELIKAKQTIFELQEKEHKMKDRLAEQAQRMLEKGIRFENVCIGERRPTALIRRYGNLYAQARVDTLDALDSLIQLKDADELKSKLLFSVVVLAFRSVQHTLLEIKHQLSELLQVPESLEPTVKELDLSVNAYLRASTDRFDTRKNIEEVCTQIWATLYDYPCLKSCDGLIIYIRDCVKLAWALSVQSPPFVIEYETRLFRRDMHVRFHTSNQEFDTIKTYLWPALLEESANGPCVHKGVIIT